MPDPVPGIPQRRSLISQTVAYLKRRIEENQWSDWLPGERGLCDEIQVSRNTLRAALVELKRDGVIEAIQGSGNRIIRSQSPQNRDVGLQSRNVAVLTPDPLESLRPAQALWIDGLRGMLSERDCRLHVFHGRQYYRTNPGEALEKLTSQNPHGCWILIMSNQSVQRWFERSVHRCITAGSVYPGIDLPFRDLDHRAICRHAVGRMLGLGHRCVALVIQKSRRAGDVDSETGFKDGVELSRHRDVEVVICDHEFTVASIKNTVRRLMERKNRPTALLVANAYHFVTVVGGLASLGWRVPQDVSVISRDEDPFLPYVVPEPARYVTSPHTMAKALLTPVLELLEKGAVSHRESLIMPNFILGESLTRKTEG